MLYYASYEDIIYIVIGIIWIAYSIYKGTQKSKARSGKKQPVNKEEKQEKKSVFETFFNDVLNEEKPATFIPYEENIKVTDEDMSAESSEKSDAFDASENEQERIFSYDDFYEEGNFPKDTNVIQHDGSVNEVSDKEISATILKERKKPRFDLRKAVVYSEILNRRYF